jgi:hypothetical protein
MYCSKIVYYYSKNYDFVPFPFLACVTHSSSSWHYRPLPFVTFTHRPWSDGSVTMMDGVSPWVTMTCKRWRDGIGTVTEQNHNFSCNFWQSFKGQFHVTMTWSSCDKKNFQTVYFMLSESAAKRFLVRPLPV